MRAWGPPAEEELLDLLAEKARRGNVAAIRSLLAREYVKDPRTRAVDLFAEMGRGAAAVSELVVAAFEALGMGATRRDVVRVAGALRATGDPDVFALFGWPDPDARLTVRRSRRLRTSRCGPARAGGTGRVHGVRAAGLVAVPGSGG